MSEQSEALRLADHVESCDMPDVAAKLRHLHYENEAFSVHLSERMKDLARVEAENEALRAQRDALLEALRRVCNHGTRDHAQIVADWDSARAAIDAAKERT